MIGIISSPCFLIAHEDGFGGYFKVNSPIKKSRSVEVHDRPCKYIDGTIDVTAKLSNPEAAHFKFWGSSL
jgi:hypothetical protein